MLLAFRFDQSNAKTCLTLPVCCKSSSEHNASDLDVTVVNSRTPREGLPGQDEAFETDFKGREHTAPLSHAFPVRLIY
jgi:hypothetical protein